MRRPVPGRSKARSDVGKIGGGAGAVSIRIPGPGGYPASGRLALPLLRPSPRVRGYQLILSLGSRSAGGNWTKVLDPRMCCGNVDAGHEAVAAERTGFGTHRDRSTIVVAGWIPRACPGALLKAPTPRTRAAGTGRPGKARGNVRTGRPPRSQHPLQAGTGWPVRGCSASGRDGRGRGGRSWRRRRSGAP